MRHTTPTHGPRTWARRATAALGVVAVGTTTLVAGAVPALADQDVVSYTRSGDTLLLTCAQDLGDANWVLDYASWDISNGWDGTSASASNVPAQVAPYEIDLTTLAGGDYHVFLRCSYRPTYQGGSGWTPVDLHDQLTYLAAPSAVRDLRATPGDGAVGLTWSTPDRDSGLPVTYDITSDQGLSTSTTDLWFTDTGLTNGTPVEYTVTARTSAGSSAPAVRTATPAGPVVTAYLTTPFPLQEGQPGGLDAYLVSDGGEVAGSVHLELDGAPLTGPVPLDHGSAHLPIPAPPRAGGVTYTLVHTAPGGTQTRYDRLFTVAAAPSTGGSDDDSDDDDSDDDPGDGGTGGGETGGGTGGGTTPTPGPTTPPTPSTPTAPGLTVPRTVTTTVGTPAKVTVTLPAAPKPRPTTLVVTEGGREIRTVTVPATGDVVVDLGVLSPGTHELVFGTPALTDVLAWSAPVTVTVAGEPAASAGAPTARLAGSTDTARVGQQIELVARDFQPGETVVFYLHSEPVLLGTAVADAEGVARLTVALPAGVPDGAHHVRATGGTSGRTAEIALTVGTSTTTPAAAPELATTGASTAAMVALQVVLIGGGVLLLVARRRMAARA